MTTHVGITPSSLYWRLYTENGKSRGEIYISTEKAAFRFHFIDSLDPLPADQWTPSPAVPGGGSGNAYLPFNQFSQYVDLVSSDHFREITYTDADQNTTPPTPASFSLITGKRVVVPPM
jgi:hypothetical protein